MQLRVWLRSGAIITLVTNSSDAGWRTTYGPIVYDNIYIGEAYGTPYYACCNIFMCLINDALDSDEKMQ